MPLLIDTARFSSAIELRSARCLTIGLVNNMPDAALEATERQFVGLLSAAASDAAVRLKLYAIADVPRGDRARDDMAGRYRDISELFDTRLDGLIVTGTEPRAANLKDEPYWAALREVVDWARKNTLSAVWSCLAAHAAVLHADGVERQRFADKISGVFECDIVDPDRFTKIGARPLRVPHSRYNDLPEPALTASGYRVLTRSGAAGVDMFAKEQGAASLFLFLQGHPEYDTITLLREYRRDIARFLRGEREGYPAMPQGYLRAEAAAVANAFETRALREPSADLIDNFPTAALEAGLEDTWRRSALGLYQRWVDYLWERRSERQTPVVPGRRSWRSRREAWPGERIPAADGSSR
jgi:homoserine O-succinyltransferase/O-acetyltransferase